MSNIKEAYEKLNNIQREGTDFKYQELMIPSDIKIKEISLQNGYNEIRLTVNKYNQNTIYAYLKWGFKTIDAVVTDIGSGFVMDDYIMSWNRQ